MKCSIDNKIPVALRLLSVAAATVLATPASAFSLEEHGIYYSAGFVNLDIDSTSSELNISDLGATTALAINEGPIADSGAKVTGTAVPAITFGYRFKNLDKWSVETIIAPPIEMTMELTGTAANESLAPLALVDEDGNGVPTGIPALGSQLATSQSLPATTTLVFNPMPDAVIQPYVGIGATVILTFDHKITNPVLLENGDPKMEVDPAVGSILQLGVKAKLGDKITVTADLKKTNKVAIGGRVKNMTLVSPSLGDLLGPSTIGEGSIDLELESTVLSAGISYAF